MVKLLVKLADKAINGHNNTFCQTCTYENLCYVTILQYNILNLHFTSI